MNYAPTSRGKRRLKPFIDYAGKVFSGNLFCVRPRDPRIPLEFLWSIMISPLANLFAQTHLLKRHILTGTMESLPVPRIEVSAVNRVTKCVKEYFAAAGRGERDILNPTGYRESEVRDYLIRLDAEVLRLYDLPSHAERLLLDQFTGEQRPGVPFPFTTYYPSDFTADVPLYVYLSDSFQQFVRGKTPQLKIEQEQRHDVLVAKSDAGRITSSEKEELHRLQAEVDGRDYALQVAQGGGPRQPAKHPRSIDAKLKRLDDSLASAMLKEARDSLYARGQPARSKRGAKPYPIRL